MIKRIKNESISQNVLRLHSSERNSSMNEIFEEFKSNITDKDIRYYPNTDDLLDPLSKFYETNNFLIGFGSDRCIKLFFESNINKKLIITEPTFPMYEVYGNMFNMEIVKIPYTTLKFPANKFLKNIDEKSIVVISNPSSPIGDIISEKNIIKILNFNVPTLIDEAYIEFSDEKSFISKLGEYENLYVTRTFSKALGSAGIRFGLIFSNNENIKKMEQFRDMFETTGLTIKWVKTLLNHSDNIDRYIKDVKENRKIIFDIFRKLGYDVVYSNSNWIHIKGFTNFPKNIILKTNCCLPKLGNDWVRLQITDNLDDYSCLLK